MESERARCDRIQDAAVFSIKPEVDPEAEVPFWTREKIYEKNVEWFGAARAEEIEDRVFCLQVANGSIEQYEKLYSYTPMSKVWELQMLKLTVQHG